MTLVGRALRPDDALSLADLFDASGSPCFCRYWHFDGDKNAWLARCAFEPEVNRAQLVDSVERQTDQGRGVVALEEGVVVGFAKLSAATTIPKVYGERYYRSLVSCDRKGVFAIACFLVHPDYRKRGVSGALVAAAIDEAKRAGASALEAFPRVVEHDAADEELWRGPITALTAHGFSPCAGDAAYPVMRLVL